MAEMTNWETAQRALILMRAQRRVADMESRYRLRERACNVLTPSGTGRFLPTPEWEEALGRWEAAKARLQTLYRETVVAEDLPGELVRDVLEARVAHVGADVWCRRIAEIPGGPVLDPAAVDTVILDLRMGRREQVPDGLRLAMMREDDAARRRGLDRATGAGT